MLIRSLLNAIDACDEFVMDILYLGGSIDPINVSRRARGLDPWISEEKRKRIQKEALKELETQKRQKIANLLCYMQRKGLVEKTTNKALRLTNKGRQKLELVNQKLLSIADTPPIQKGIYTENDALKVVIFDVPEQDKWKRKWLRQSLQNLDFTLLQKSVWIGKRKLPEEFIQLLSELDLLPHVHIFTIQEQGTVGYVDNVV